MYLDSEPFSPELIFLHPGIVELFSSLSDGDKDILL